MAGIASFFLPSAILLSLILSSSAQSCINYKFPNNRIFNSCNNLPYLNAFLHWNYESPTGKLQIAYRQIQITTPTWVSWAINPSSDGMIGAQSLVAIQNSDGTTKVYTSPVMSYRTQLPAGKLSFSVSDLSATFGNGEVIIFATLGILANSSVVNHVWQEGPLSGGIPAIHGTSSDNVLSKGSLNLLSGQSETAGGAMSRIRKKNIHGVLNAISWGIMMPIGAIIARYLKVWKSAEPAWFYLHVVCQCSAYTVGVAGWATGLKLGSESKGIQYDTHRNIGIILFCLATLQVFALLLRPQKEHKYRLYWNIYHHLVGYTVIILSIINILKGFNILNPQKKWKYAYIGFILVLAFKALVLEVYTWYVVLKRKRSQSN